MKRPRPILVFAFLNWLSFVVVSASGQEVAAWKYSPELLHPFWVSEVIQSEPILFIRDEQTKEARGSLLFPIEDVIAVTNAAGDITYQEGVDYRFQPGTREIVVPRGSKVVTALPADLRRPAKSQRHALTHRDGNGEILFGAKLEYHQMQTMVTYKKQHSEWPVAMPSFKSDALPITLQKLRDREDVSIVLMGDSISTGCNASAWGKGAPFQPAYQDLLLEHLRKHYQTNVTLTNLSVGGTATPWGITMIDQVLTHKPDLVVLAFGMNDSAGRSGQEYGKNVASMIAKTRAELPKTEFILIASMLGNRDWVALKHDVFPQYRDELAALCQPGVALADMTSVWEEFLKRKKDCDLTGNGVNHPNDFGHRVYAQVLSALLVEQPE
ncbi:MAG: SGNH/GDSL hydrolase family protein [Planctomycetaceae bacterium]